MRREGQMGVEDNTKDLRASIERDERTLHDNLRVIVRLMRVWRK